MKKRFAALLTSVCMVFGVFSGFSASAEAVITMDKQSYYAGEAHTVEYSGVTGSEPWWGIYWRDEIPGAPGIGSRMWGNLSSGSGKIDFAGGAVSGSSVKWSDLSVGEYKLCIIPNEDKILDANGVSIYNVIAQVDFEIVKNTQKPSKPENAVYERDSDAKAGFANGRIIITPPANTENMSGYAAYWGDDNSVFDGYAPIKIDGIVDSGKTTKTYEIVDNTFIPAGATKLYVYSARGTAISNNPNDIVTSAEAAASEIPQGAALDEETPLYSFQVTSDWHVFGGGTENNIKAKRLDEMLKDVKETDPDSIAIFGVGDIIDNSLDDKSSAGITVEKALSEFSVVNSVIDANSDNLPPIYYGVGNHDLRGFDGYQAQLERFLENTGTDYTGGKPYYYKEISGAKFIMLGSEKTADNESHNAYLSQTQLKWLEQTLAQNSKTTEPIFVFLHQGMKNTVAGTTRGFGWDGVDQDSQLRAILKKYPNAVYFSGHTHWELEAYDNIFTGYGADFSAFNTAGIGKVYTDEKQDKEGSQGLYVEVYKDKILVKGRDFENKLWVTSAQFMLDISLPASVKTASLTKNKSAILENGGDILSLYKELEAIEGDKGSFESVYTALANAKAVYENIDSGVKEFKTKLDTLKQQVSDKNIQSDLFLSLRNEYRQMSSEQKEYLSGADTIFEKAAAIERQNKAARITEIVLIDKSGSRYTCIYSNSGFKAAVPDGTDLSVMKLEISSNDKDAAFNVNDAVYTVGDTVDLSAKQIRINTIGSFGDELYNNEYNLTISIETKSDNGGTQTTVTMPKNGTKSVNGKTLLYKDGKAVTGTRLATVSGKTYAVIGGYLKTGKVRIVKIGLKSYIVNKSGVVIKSSKNKLIKVGSKSYIVNKAGVVQKGKKNKLVKIGKKSYVVNKKGVVQKNKKSVKVGKKTYKTNKKGVAALKKK